VCFSRERLASPMFPKDGGKDFQWWSARRAIVCVVHGARGSRARSRDRLADLGRVCSSFDLISRELGRCRVAIGSGCAPRQSSSEKGFNEKPDKDTARQSSGTEPAADNYRSGGALCRNSPRTRQVRSHHDVFSRLSSRAICLE